MPGAPVLRHWHRSGRASSSRGPDGDIRVPEGRLGGNDGVRTGGTGQLEEGGKDTLGLEASAAQFANDKLHGRRSKDSTSIQFSAMRRTPFRLGPAVPLISASRLSVPIRVAGRTPGNRRLLLYCISWGQPEASGLAVGSTCLQWEENIAFSFGLALPSILVPPERASLS